METKLVVVLSVLLMPTCAYALFSDDLRVPMRSPSSELLSRFEMIQLMPKNGIVAEIGVERGDFAAAILKYTNPKKLYLIDCWEHEGSSTHEKQQRNFERVQQRFAQDPRVVIIKAFSAEAVKLFEDNFFDWLYLDANHAYASVSGDLESWYPKIKAGGIFAGHGYTSHLLRPEFGVVQAINEFLRKHTLEMVYLTNETFTSWAIKKTAPKS